MTGGTVLRRPPTLCIWHRVSFEVYPMEFVMSRGETSVWIPDQKSYVIICAMVKSWIVYIYTYILYIYIYYTCQGMVINPFLGICIPLGWMTINHIYNHLLTMAICCTINPHFMISFMTPAIAKEWPRAPAAACFCTLEFPSRRWRCR